MLRIVPRQLPTAISLANFAWQFRLAICRGNIPWQFVGGNLLSRRPCRIFPAMKIAILLLLSISFGQALVFEQASAADLPLPSTLIDLDSPAGQRMFLEANARAAYWPLSSQFETQANQAFCGVASIVMVLNSLKIEAPVPAGYAPYQYFTQDDLFPAGGQTILQGEWIAHHGLTLDQLGSIAQHYHLAAKIVHATANGLPQFREEAAQALATPGQYVLVNFRRASLGEEGYGHISPLAAYDVKTDRFLVLDVARYKYPPNWVRSADLYAALDTPDPSNGNAMRGYILLSKSN